jgi:mRNA-degrading endonuclease YafQ of YafQ-DinJ toxin-antitoxin module
LKTLVWGSSFVRAFKKAVRHRPELRGRLEQALRQLAADPFAPALHTHKLKGPLAGAWACTAGYGLPDRI